jgi:hypothetical protein
VHGQSLLLDWRVCEAERFREGLAAESMALSQTTSQGEDSDVAEFIPRDAVKIVEISAGNKTEAGAV